MINPETTARLDAKAQQILRANDKGGYTVPTKGLYPFQWNWDSALTALGIACFDADRAWQEIEKLLSAQWDNGMVPHIVFWQHEEGYFPGPGEWQSGRTPPTSGITQPPVAATIVRQLANFLPGDHSARVTPMLHALDRWHQWFADARDPDGRGVVAIMHPWESGRDNLPDWDAPLAHVDTSHVGAFLRRDTQLVNAAERPRNHDYDHYMALVQFGRNCQWHVKTIAEKCPFWVAEPGMNAILRRAERDLVALALQFNLPSIATRATHRLARLDHGFNQLWSDIAKGYTTLDLRNNKLEHRLSSGSWLSLYGGPENEERAEIHCSTLNRWRQQIRFALPSFDPGDPAFDDIRYWRGPVWAMINWMIATGLAEHGHPDMADQLADDTAALIDQSAFREYFSPVTGKGGGGKDFSWTAAMWLYWASPSARQKTETQ